MSINKVAIVGGTHGNEITGYYLLQKWQDSPELIQRPSLNTSTLLANPKAYEISRRYVDQDLNRQFARHNLEDPTLGGYEQNRAKVINQAIGPKGNPKSDLVIDLHTTTSNMGPTLLMPQSGEFYNKLAAYIKMQMPSVTIFRDEDHKSNDEHHLLATVGKYGVIVEVGPVPQAVLRHDVFQQTEQMVNTILDFAHLYNENNLPDLPRETEAFRFLQSLTLPLNEKGERIGMIHQSVQDSDFKALNPGDPLFQLFNGETITYAGDKTVYTAFVNEAAYYDKNLATSLMEKVVIINE
ncbi:aspartoacylase [Saccharobesus litoralis]|uniref:aspartoacylase n=1 Tax=Saccharobesus litoralis TaxID=2172099 RepID=UPI0026A475A3|nr:aspartoacylase [Saccharobesus litoralis]